MTENPLRFAVVASDPALARLLQEAFDGSGVAAELVLRIEGTLEDGAEHVSRLKWAGTQVVLAEVGGDLGGCLTALRRVMTEAPGTTVMLAGPNLPADALLRLIRAGAVEYLPGPVTAEDVSDAARRVIARRNAWTGEVREDGRTFGVFGAKGGSGVSTTAVNLALELRALTGRSTLLVDLDLLDGGAEVQLDLQARYTISDLIGSFHRLDEGLLKSFVLTHSSGLQVIAAPRTAMEGEKITPDQATQLVRVLRSHYDLVVMDVGNLLTSVALAALSEADEHVMVLAPHLECLRNAKRAWAALGQKVPRLKDRSHVVLNRFTSDSPIAISEVERAVGSSVDTVLPYDDAMLRRSACGGQPAALAGPSKYGKQLRSLATAAGQIEATRNGNGRVRTFFGGLLRRNGSKRKAVRPTHRVANATR